MNRSKLDLGVGVFVVIGIVSLLFLSLKVGNLGGEKIERPYQVHARFDNIGGLKVRAPVKASGVLVGRVTDIRYDTEHFQATVTFNVDSRYAFSRDTFATINTAGLLGEQYVALKPGGDEQNLKSGDTITKTQSAMVLEDMIGRFLFDKASEGSKGSN
ncbi:outer membrane lipid asymmetry maintenance protein MlaD [Niveibacterium umoris]|uniref:Phospholipid/cholesterol/gamma-HCH transport system substrate-binding protein n=1 Tax=Niveibacterium umoris TaxID=1193620 RepID=A0A840BQQ9_9RHOO|nr:outer membrane lipid asymmetry maintenance protein MlaD [Niveibacterium umoris]MBB4012747.1 phospholipid/cholesterol/gamma-HCH transport system substrate-binding protein [Niveibacterium umoris]